jgi:amino acid permease
VSLLQPGVASTDSASRNGHKVAADELPLLPPSFASSDTIEEGHRSAKGSHDEDESPHEVATANMGSAVFNLATTIIGAGIMALPATMRVLGMPIGLLVICTMGVVSELSIEMIVHFLAIAKVWTFGDLVGNAAGWAARAVAQICIIINNAGILIVYLIIIGDVLAGSKNHVGLFEEWTGGAGWWSDRKLIVLITMLLVLAPLSSLRRIDSLHFSSAASVALALVFVFLSSVIASVKLAMGRLAMPRMLPSFASKHAILELLTVIPIMSNAFVCHFNVPPIYLELRNRSPAKMFKVGRITAILCVLVYSATALSGYLLFGDLTNSDVLVNFDADLGIPFSGVLDDGIRIGYVLHLMLVFPVIHFSLRQTIDAVLFPERPPLPESKYRFGIITFVLLVLIFVGSTVVPNIWVAFQFTGATTGLSLGFIFPALVVIRSKYKRGNRAHESLPLAWTILVMAIVISFLGIGTQIYNITTGQGS